MRDYKKIKGALMGAALAVTGASLAGCGGSSSTPAVIFPISNTLRTLQPGDAWQYSVTGSIHTSTQGVKDPQMRAGTYTRSVGTSTNPRAQFSMAEESVFTFDKVGLSTTTNVISDFSQDVPGIFQVDDNREASGNTEFADGQAGNGKGSQQILPGGWSPTTGLATSDSYTVFTLQSDGSTTVHTGNQEQISITVVGQEVVKTPAGTFTTWKAAISQHLVTQNADISGFAWWAPQIGSFVKMTTAQSTPDGIENLTYILQSTTVAH